jgi:hypothetical protein
MTPSPRYSNWIWIAAIVWASVACGFVGLMVGLNISQDDQDTANVEHGNHDDIRTSGASSTRDGAIKDRNESNHDTGGARSIDTPHTADERHIEEETSDAGLTHFLQSEFESKRDKFNREYHEAINEIKMSAVWVEANKWTKEFGDRVGWKIENWHGRILKISTNQGGDTVAIGIASSVYGTRILYRTWDNFLSDIGDETIPTKGSKIYNQVAELKVGDTVHFSAELLRDSTKGIREISLTESGSLREPEFIVRFTDISKTKQ